MIKKCRICDGEFFEKPILSLKNMPESAQGFLAYKSDNQTMDINMKVFIQRRISLREKMVN